jgi:hypothetical protein
VAEHRRFRPRTMPTALDKIWEHSVTDELVQADPLIAGSLRATRAEAAGSATAPARTPR